MFSGIIESIGILQEKTEIFGMHQLTFYAPKISPHLTLGESVAINGVCLSVVEHNQETFCVQLSQHTLDVTLFSSMQVGQQVNLERSLKMGERLSGHFVQGHVDGVAKIMQKDVFPDSSIYCFSLQASLRPYVAYKGSIAVDGVSLTVAKLTKESFCVALIPITLQSTNLQHKFVGDEVHVETDMIARYLASLLPDQLQQKF